MMPDVHALLVGTDMTQGSEIVGRLQTVAHPKRKSRRQTQLFCVEALEEQPWEAAEEELAVGERAVGILEGCGEYRMKADPEALGDFERH
jgi:hypothetical protein